MANGNNRLRNVVALAVSLCTIAGQSACSNRSDRVARANDELRAANSKLDSDNRDLKLRIQELDAQLKLAATSTSGLSPDVIASLPLPVEISIGRLSFARDTNSDGQPDQLVIYIHPTDGLARFTQMVGTLSVQAAILPQGSVAQTIGSVTLTPDQLRAAYRSSVTGTHYVVEMPISVPDQAGAKNHVAHVEATFEDGVAKRTLTASATVKLQ